MGALVLKRFVGEAKFRGHFGWVGSRPRVGQVACCLAMGFEIGNCAPRISDIRRISSIIAPNPLAKASKGIPCSRQRFFRFMRPMIPY